MGNFALRVGSGNLKFQISDFKGGGEDNYEGRRMKDEEREAAGIPKAIEMKMPWLQIGKNGLRSFGQVLRE